MKKFHAFILILLLAVVAGCSSSNSDAPVVGGSGTGAGSGGNDVHPTTWISDHGAQAATDLRGCQGCHGFDFKGSGQAVSCFTCHDSGPPFTGHPASWNGNPKTGHQLNFSGDPSLPGYTSWNSCATAACHGTDLQGTGTSGAPSCMDSTTNCHSTSTNGGWPPAPANHAGFTPASNGNHGLAAKGKTDPTLSMGNYCSICHADANQPLATRFNGGFVATYYSKGNCSACHSAATAHPGNWASTRTGNSVFHNDGNISANPNIKTDSCALCHTTTGATPASPFTGAPTCFNADFNGLTCHSGGPSGAPHDTLNGTGIDYTEADRHGPAAKADLAYCASCHATGTAIGSNPTFDVQKGRLTNGCEDCHATGSAHASGTDRWTFNKDTSQTTRRTHFAAGNINTGCVLCHDATSNTNDDTGSAPACTTCHTSLTASGPAAVFDCTVCHGQPPTTGTDLTGGTLVNHAAGTDVTTISNHEDCSICHGVSESTGTPGTLSPKASDYVLFTGAGAGGNHLDGKIEVNTAVGYQDANSTAVSERFGCTSACHPNDANHKMADSAIGTNFGNYTTGSITCTDCHGYPPAGVNAAPGATPASHMGSDSGVTLLANHGECQTCHGTKDNGSNGHDNLTNYDPATNHYNGLINMNSTTGYNQSNGGCDSAVCHLNDASHRIPPTSSLTVQSGDYGAGSCSTCHGYPPSTSWNATSTIPAGMLHVDHLGSDNGATLLANHGECQTCHGTRDSAGAHDPVSPYDPATMHRDNKIQMNSDAGYNSTNFGCDSAGCHSNDTSHRLADSNLTVDPLALGGAGTCDTCHGGLPTDTTPISSNAHTAHISSTTSVSLTCDVCHGHNGSGATHNQGGGVVDPTNVDINFSTGLGAGGSYSGTATKQCSNIYCHGTSNTPDWDAGTGGACGDCHGANGTGRPDNANKPSGGNHLSTTHAAQTCNACHPHNGTDTTNHVNGSPTANANGDAQISTTGSSKITTHSYGATGSGSPDLDGFRYSASTCSSNNAACHTTAVWGATGGCDFCHGYPPNSTNNKHAPGFTAVNHPSLPNFDTHHDDCSFCHGVKDNGSSSQVAMAQTVLGGTESYVTGTGTGFDHKDGQITINGPSPSTGAGYNAANGGCDNGVCHSNDGTHRVGSGGTGNSLGYKNFGPGKCSSCHDSGVNGAPVVTSTSSHVKTTVAGSFNACEDCHSGHVGTGGVTIELPSNNWTNASGETHVTGNMQTALGIDYTSHGGINLGGPGTVSSINTKTTEAEICWGCHDANNIGELDSGAGAGLYKFGVLSTSQTNVNNHVSDWTTSNAWRIDADDPRLTRPIASIHTVNMNGTAGHSSSVANNIVSGRVKRGSLNSSLPGNAANQGNSTSPVFEGKQYIRCSYCHDVHSLNKAPSDSGTSAPYLRGTWTSDPYNPDVPPTASESYSGSTHYYNSQQGNGLPRPKSTAVTGGGFYIDQNSGNPTNQTANNSVAKTAGLCTICHGTSVTGMDYYTGSRMWQGTSGHNGHANSTLGGNSSTGINLFDPRRGSSWYMAMQGSASLGSKIDSTGPPWGKNTSMKKTRATGNSGWYGGTVDSNTRGGQYNDWYDNGSVGSLPGSNTNQAHKFTCSKCHSPHATGLPALLKTNCIDVQISGYTNSTRSNANYNASTANNCHRKTSTSTGWHTLAPQQ